MLRQFGRPNLVPLLAPEEGRPRVGAPGAATRRDEGRGLRGEARNFQQLIVGELLHER